MGLIPKVDKPSPAFIHVDVDDLWAVAECYGYEVADEWAHHISQEALPRFEALFREQGIKATFFIVGRDLEVAGYLAGMRHLLQMGHVPANHSWSHSLRFRELSKADMDAEISQSHQMIEDQLGVSPQGFRAPGYAWSQQLMDVLEERQYTYDSSLMPGPYGGVFRWMDGRMQQDRDAASRSGKTQYPVLSDTFKPLYPAPVRHGRLVEIPSATSPLVRLPFQAGVCMRLGYGYFSACLLPFRLNPALPFVFLFHAADLADFSAVPYPLFQQSKFFNMPIENRINLARRFLQAIRKSRPVITTEDWLSSM